MVIDVYSLDLWALDFVREAIILKGDYFALDLWVNSFARHRSLCLYFWDIYETTLTISTKHETRL